MTIHFAPLIRKKQARTYIDDTIMQAQIEFKMFEIIDKYHEHLWKSGLKFQTEKIKFSLRKAQFLGHVVGKRRKLYHKFFRYQLVISLFQNLKIIWTKKLSI